MKLPEYPVEVTRNSSLKVNTSLTRSPEAYVKTLLQLPLTDQRYQIDQYGTKCNFYVRDCLVLMGYQLLPHELANDMVRLATAGEYSVFVPMSLEVAVNHANQGCPTWAGLEAKGHGHVVMVLPQPATTNPADVAIAQAGRKNFWGWKMKHAWTQGDLLRVKFFGAP